MAAWQYGMIWNVAFAESPDDKLIHGKQPFAVVGGHLRAAVPGGRAGITHQSVDVHQVSETRNKPCLDTGVLAGGQQCDRNPWERSPGLSPTLNCCSYVASKDRWPVPL